MTPPPSLGRHVCDWIEKYCVHGVGEKMGEPVKLTPFQVEYLYTLYEIRADGKRLHRKAYLTLPKGSAKSETAGFVALVEGLGPCRFGGWSSSGEPIAVAARSPQVVCAATEVTQAGLSYGVVHLNLTESRRLRDKYPDVDPGMTRTLLPGGGSIRPITAGAASKEGALPTFIVCDEVGYWTLPEHHRLWEILVRGLVKRPSTGLLAISTAHRPGEMSVGERLFEEARSTTSPMLFVSRTVAPGVDADDPVERLAGLRQVYEGVAPWVDLDEVSALYEDATLDPAEFRRHFFNEVVSDSSRFVEPAVWRDAARPAEVLQPGDRVALGFDGSIREDSTALVAVRISDGLVSLVDVWQRPPGAGGASWTVPFGSVDAVVRETFQKYDVTRMYCDPFGWSSYVNDWSRDFHGVVVEWETRRFKQMDVAIERFAADLRAGRLTHDGGTVLTEHVMNAHLRQRSGYRTVTKERNHSPKKIDAAIAAILAWEAAADAGVTPKGKRPGRVLAFR
jgi:phage terminase large subunit-like protein